jgi:hypothetical protein
LRNVGAVRGEHRDGSITVSSAASVRLTARRAVVSVERVRDTVQGELTDGRFIIRKSGGKVALETRRGEVEVEEPEGGATVACIDGSVTVRAASAPVAFEGERCRFMFVPGATAALTAASVDARIEAQVPSSGGISLDLAAEDGRLELADVALHSTRNGNTESALGEIAGGGPVWRIRTTRGNIIIRK